MRYRLFTCAMAALAVIALSLGSVSLTQAQTRQQNAPQRSLTYAFPDGAVVFPEGITKDPNSSFFYVGSSSDGTIYRGDMRQPNRGLSVFLPGGIDGRTAATGMKVDNRGFLWISGAATGNIWMYDTRDGRLLSQFNNGVSDTFINDVTVTPDGAAYFTRLTHANHLPNRAKRARHFYV